MSILVADLHENAAGIGKKVACDGKAIAEIGEVAMDAIAPSVPEGFDLLRLAGDVADVILYVATGSTPLEVAVELDAVGRIDVNALHPAAQPLAFGEAGHDLE